MGSRVGHLNYVDKFGEDSIITCSTLYFHDSEYRDSDRAWQHDTYLRDEVKITVGSSIFRLASVDRFSDTSAVVCYNDFDSASIDTIACVGLNLVDERFGKHSITTTEPVFLSD